MKPPEILAVGFAVRRLFKDGCRLPLRAVERSPAIIGSLELVTLRYENERALRVLELRDGRNGIQPRLLPALQDPVLYTLGAVGLLVRGSEAIEAGGRIREYTQEWHIQFVMSAAAGGASDDGVAIDRATQKPQQLLSR